MAADRDEVFKGWMQAHLGVLHRVSRAFAADADQHDLMQELMLAVWRAAPMFRGESAESTFIFRVAHNAALTWRRRESARVRRMADAIQQALESPAPGDDGEEALLARLYAAIHTLAPLDRSLMLLSLEGLSYTQIGEIHALSETNVGARLSRARKKLASLVENHD